MTKVIGSLPSHSLFHRVVNYCTSHSLGTAVAQTSMLSSIAFLHLIHVIPCVHICFTAIVLALTVKAGPPIRSLQGMLSHADLTIIMSGLKSSQQTDSPTPHGIQIAPIFPKSYQKWCTDCRILHCSNHLTILILLVCYTGCHLFVEISETPGWMASDGLMSGYRYSFRLNRW